MKIRGRIPKMGPKKNITLRIYTPPGSGRKYYSSLFVADSAVRNRS
jgi:hypothetical protein